MKKHMKRIITATAWPEGTLDPDQAMVDAISDSCTVTVCKACEKEFDMDGLVYCKDCRVSPGMAYNNYDIEDL